MLENSELGADEHSLTTWRLPLWPCDNQQIVLQLPAHRIEWLNREGPVSEGRGYVKRVCRGHCRVLGHTPDRWHVCFQTVDLNPEDPAVADAWPGDKTEVELVFEKFCGPIVDDRWQVSVR